MFMEISEEVAQTLSLQLGQMMPRLDQMMELAGTAPVTAWILRMSRVMAWILRTARWPHHRNHRERSPPNLCDGCNQSETKSSTDRESPSAKAMSPLRMGREIPCEEFEGPFYCRRFTQGRL